MFRRKDLLDVLRISRAALAYERVDALRSGVLGLLDDAFESERANFFLARSSLMPSLDLGNVASIGVEERYKALFRDYYHKVDPFRTTIRDAKTIVTTRHVASPADFDRSEYYNDFLKPQGLRGEMAVYLRCGGRLLGILALLRSQREQEFSPREEAKAEMLAPHLSGALARAMLAERLLESERMALQGAAKEAAESCDPDFPHDLSGVGFSARTLRLAGLTHREMEVAALVCQGSTNKEIAEKLFISPYTVGNHLRAVYEKLGVRNRTGMAHRVSSLRKAESGVRFNTPASEKLP